MSHKKSAKVVTPDPDLVEWCKALAESSAPLDVVPPGWLTVQELAKQLRRAVPTLQSKVRQLHLDGKAECQFFRIQLAKNRRPVPHYRLP